MKSITLRTGANFPTVGLGVWKIAKPQTADVVEQALKIGYRHLDCACDYGNEVEVGHGLKAAVDGGICSRDDVWVTSKLWNTYHAAEHVRPACEKTLQDLGLDYLDLYLIHFPISLKYVPIEERYPPEWLFNPNAENPTMEEAPVPISETWGAMEGLVEAGLVKNIGVCNFGTSLLRDLLSYAKIPPAVLQVESHPYLTQDKLVRFCKENEIAYTAFSPLGALSYFELGMADKTESLIEEPLLKQAAEAHGKTAAQVALRWGVQRGTAVIPKSSKPERLKENLDIFDFELTADEMAAISALDQHKRFNDPGDFGEKAFNTFFPIYE